jgi:methyltransferase (TIGR00027 family)
MTGNQSPAPDSTAVRTALWRALHVQVDRQPHLIDDEIGLQLAEPGEGWRERGDMDVEFTKSFRTSIVTRARFIEDLVEEQVGSGVGQYVILGAGLDTFAQRKPEIASRLQIFEVDQSGPQAWKRARLVELGFGLPDRLHFVPVDFEAGLSWWDALPSAGFDASQPAVVASSGVSMYLTRDAIMATLRQVATLAARSTLAMTFLLPLELNAPAERGGLEASSSGARASGTPFISFFAPEEMVALAHEAGFKEAHCIPPEALAERYFSGRTDGLEAPTAERILVATT